MDYEQYRPAGFKLLPPVVKNILIITGLFYLATISLQRYVDLQDVLGMHYFAAEKFKIYQVITYMFMHGSLQHVFFNMFAFWMFGYALENVWGSKRFLIFFLVTGIGAALIQMLVYYIELAPLMHAIDTFKANPTQEAFRTFLNTTSLNTSSGDMLSSYNPQEAIGAVDRFSRDFLNEHLVVGSSGAVFGILLAFGMLFPDTRIYIYFFIPMKAKWFVIIYGAIELVAGFGNFSGDNVAHFAHLGGMLFGFILIMIWRKQARNKMFR
jgi:membrane associated rhomboid family serine protease